MLKFLTIIAAAMVGLAVSAQTASAGFKIPCTGDRLVKVMDVPKSAQPEGKTIHLGYRFPGCFEDGEWVGYSGSGSTYYELKGNNKTWILNALGRTEFPKAPSRWDYPFEALLVEIITAGVLVLFGLYELIKGMFFARKEEEEPQAEAGTEA